MRVEIDHVAIRTIEFDKARAFFEDVFSMQCYREVGQKPERKLWFLEGVQLCEVEALPKGENGYDHFSLGVEDVEAVMKYVEKEYPECEIVNDHWFRLPNRTEIELKPFRHAYMKVKGTTEK